VYKRQEHEASGNRLGIAQTLRGLARIDRRQGKGSQALRALTRSLQLLDQIGERRTAADCRLDLASLERERGELNAAQQQLEHALDTYQDLNYPRGRASALVLLGNILLDMGHTQRAMSRIEAAAGIARELEDHHLQALSTLNMGRTLMLMGQSERAREQLQRSKHLAEQRHYLDVAAIALAYEVLVALRNDQLDRVHDALARIPQVNTDIATLELGRTLEQAGDDLQKRGEHMLARQCFDLAGQAFKTVHHLRNTKRLQQKSAALPMTHHHDTPRS